MEVYIASMYFTLTTITTVGFGDVVGFTIPERYNILFKTTLELCALF